MQIYIKYVIICNVYGVGVMNKWSFDEKHLKAAIKKGQLLLTKRTISDSTKDRIKEEISVFERWLNGDYSYPYSDSVRSVNNSDEKYSFDELKKLIMHEVKICGSCFGNGYISLIEKINDNDLFAIPKCKEEIISLDEQADVTMKTYEKYSPVCLYDAAKTIILPEKPHIHVLDNDDILSYSYGSNHILNEGFVVLNPNEGNGILNYYVQEGIETLIPFGYSLEYIDLGPTLFQLLFHDKLFEEKGIKYSTDYYELISKFRENLVDIMPVLKMYQATRSSKEFEITDEMFIELCNMYFETDNLEQVYSIVHKKLNDYSIDLILSVLYAMDLREKILNEDIDALHALDFINPDYLYTKKSIDYKYSVYEKYMDTVKNRCK